MWILDRLFGGRKKAAEGEYRPGPYALGGGWLPAGSSWNFWQIGQNVQPYGEASAMVEACVSAYAQTAAMCTSAHWRKLPTGGREVVQNSALTRVMASPNDYLSGSDFMLNLFRDLYDHGNAYALALRNNRAEISELHLMRHRSCAPRIAEGGEIFYQLGGNEIIDARLGPQMIVPARDVLHVRLHTPTHPLKGVSPVLAAALDLAAAGALTRQQAAFFTNQSRPSFVLTTDEKWTKQQAQEAREAWELQSQGMNAGKTPIMGWGVKAQQIGSTAQDAQLAETLKMTDQHIALAFRMPMQVLGIGGTGTMGSTEALMNLWLASGLGFALNHVEEAVGKLFRLRPEEYLEFDRKALLRAAFKDRVEGLARAVQAGIFTINEARNDEDRPDVDGGDEPRVQQQMVPLSFGETMKPPATGATSPEPQSDAPDESDDAQDKEADEQHTAEAIAQRLYDHSRVLH